MSALGAWACLVSACAAAPAKPDKYPASEALCQYVGLESAETPQYSDRDNISLLAVYRFREPGVPAPKEPLTVKFQVNRSRVNELRSHLEAQPEVICTPENDTHYHVHVKPFEVTPEPEPPLQITPPTAPSVPAAATPPAVPAKP